MVKMLSKLILGFVGASGARVHEHHVGASPCARASSTGPCPAKCFEDAGQCHLKVTFQDEATLVKRLQDNMLDFLPALACYSDSEHNFEVTQEFADTIVDVATVAIVATSKPSFKILNANLRALADQPLSQLPTVFELKRFKWGECALTAKAGKESAAVILKEFADEHMPDTDATMIEDVAPMLSPSDEINLFMASKKIYRGRAQLFDSDFSSENLEKVLKKADEIIANPGTAATSLAELGTRGVGCIIGASGGAAMCIGGAIFTFGLSCAGGTGLAGATCGAEALR